MRTSASMMIVGLALFVSGSTREVASALEPDSGAREQAVANVAAALDSLPAQGRPLTLERGAASAPAGGHCQGIQLRFDAPGNRYLALLSHDSLSEAYLVVAELAADLRGGGRVIHVHKFPSDGKTPPLRHAGGIQLVGDILAVGLEDNQQKTRSEVQFWNFSKPTAPVKLTHLTVRRAGAPKDQTAGGVALVARRTNHLLAVANWDSRAIDFYVSNARPLDDPGARFQWTARWTADKQAQALPKPPGAYQAINLVAEPDGQVFLLGFDTTAAGRDYVDLFAVDLTNERAELRKAGSRTFDLPDACHFRAAGGAWIDRGQLRLLASGNEFGAETRACIIGLAK